MKKYLNVDFESSSGLTPQFASFARSFKSYCKKIAGNDYELISFNRGHFYCSGFFKNKATNKYAYFSTSDVRFFKNEWYNRLLVRTAKHDKDFSGGANHTYMLDQLAEAISQLTA